MQGEEGRRFKAKFLVKKAFMSLIKDRLKAKFEKKYGQKLDALADVLFEHFEAKMKVKKEMMSLEDFSLEEEMGKIFASK